MTTFVDLVSLHTQSARISKQEFTRDDGSTYTIEHFEHLNLKIHPCADCKRNAHLFPDADNWA